MIWRLSVKKISGFSVKFIVILTFLLAIAGFAASQEIQVNTTAVSVLEGGSTSAGTLTVQLTADPLGDLLVTGQWNSGDTDIQTSPNPWIFTFDSSTWNLPQEVTLTAADDADAVSDFAIIRFSGSGMTDVDVTATEIENDTLAIQTNTLAVSVPENGSTPPGTLQVWLLADPVNPLTVTGQRVSGDNDIQTSPNPWTFVFNSSNWNLAQEVTLTASEDPDANNGIANIRFSAVGVDDHDVTATEIDNDGLNILTNVTTVSVPEGGSTPVGTLTVWLTADPVDPLTVTGLNVLGDVDIQPSPDPWTFVFDSSNWNLAQEVTLTAAEDGDITDDSATIRFSATGLTDLDVIATEIDNDVTMQFTLTESSGSESTTPTLPMQVSLNEASDVNLTVDYTVTPGTATSGTDYTPVTGTATIIAGNLTSDEISVAILPDTLIEGNENFIVTLSNPLPADRVILGANTVHTYTILDDDTTNVQFTLAASSGPENVTPSSPLQVSIAQVCEVPVTVDFTVTGGTATSPDDYTLAAGTATIPAASLTSNEITIAIVNDAVVEGSETVIVTLSNPNPVESILLGTNTTHTFTIEDDEETTVQFTLTESSGPESTTPALLEVSLTETSTGTVTVDYAVTGGTATGGGVDYTLAAGTATIAPDTLTSNISIDIIPDALIEGDETIIVTLSNPVNATLGANTVHTYTIEEDDFPTVQFTVPASSGPESTTPALLEVSLSQTYPADVTVTYTVTGGTATGGGVDYTLLNGVATIPAGLDPPISNEISITVVDDAIKENNETVEVTLSAPVNAVLGANTVHTYTIVDDETMNFLINPTTVNIPEGGTATFDVSLTAAPMSLETVNVTWYSGDPDITVQLPSQLFFTTANWDEPQTVTLAAADDPDGSSDSATISVNSTNVPEAFVTAIEIDNSSSGVSMSPNPSSGTSGQTITVTVQIADSFAELSSFGFDLVYDQTIFNYIDAVPGILNSGWTITEPSSTPGRVTILASGGSIVPINSTGSIVQLTLEVKCLTLTSDTQTPIQIENYTYDMAGQFVPEPCSTTFTFIPCPSLGDVNGDSSVTPGDAQMAFEGFLGLYTPDLCEEMASDANCDGGVTPGDAQVIFEHFLGIQQIPECCASVSASIAINTREKYDIGNPVVPLIPSNRRLFPLNRIAEAGEIVRIPVVLTHPEGIRSFSFDMNYPPDLLEYLGVMKSPMTESFDYVTGTKHIKGMVRVEGICQFPIVEKNIGSLAVAIFLVKEGLQDSLPIYIYNPGDDLYDADTEKGMFTRFEELEQNNKSVILGEAVIGIDGMIRVPLEITDKFNIKSFGLEVRYSTESLEFVGMRRLKTGGEFSAVQATKIEEGIVRIGGYGRNEIQDTGPGRLVELIFFKTDFGGEIEIMQLFDDIQDFFIQNEISLLRKRKGSIR